MDRKIAIKNKIHKICSDSGYSATDPRLPMFVLNNIGYIFHCLSYVNLVTDYEYEDFIRGAADAYYDIC